jgi:hypothetical protein
MRCELQADATPAPRAATTAASPASRTRKYRSARAGMAPHLRRRPAPPCRGSPQLPRLGISEPRCRAPLPPAVHARAPSDRASVANTQLVLCHVTRAVHRRARGWARRSRVTGTQRTVDRTNSSPAAEGWDRLVLTSRRLGRATRAARWAPSYLTRSSAPPAPGCEEQKPLHSSRPHGGLLRYRRPSARRRCVRGGCTSCTTGRSEGSKSCPRATERTATTALRPFAD